MLFLKNVISEKEVPKGFHRGTTQSDSKRGQIVENHIPDFQHDVLYNMWSFRLFFTTINYESFRQQQMQAQVANLRSFKLNFCGCSMFNSKSKWWQQMKRAPILPVFLLGCEIYSLLICLHQSLVILIPRIVPPSRFPNFPSRENYCKAFNSLSDTEQVFECVSQQLPIGNIERWQIGKREERVFSGCCLINQGGNINNYIYSTQMATFW